MRHDYVKGTLINVIVGSSGGHGNNARNYDLRFPHRSGTNYMYAVFYSYTHRNITTLYVHALLCYIR